MRYCNLVRIVQLIVLIALIDANDHIKLNQEVTGVITARQNLVYKIQSCNDIEIQISTKGSIVIEAGPQSNFSYKDFSEDIKKEINNSTEKVEIQFPFVHYNRYKRICLIYLSIYGQVNKDTNPTGEAIPFTFIATPKVINQIQIIQIKNITESTPIIYANSLPSSSDIIYLFEGDSMKGNTLNVFIFKEQNQTSSNQPLDPSNSNEQIIQQSILPNFILGEEGKIIDDIKNHKKDKSSNTKKPIVKKKQESLKNTFLDLNVQQEFVIIEDKLMFLLENNDKQDYQFQMTVSHISQFQPIPNLNNLQFSGLNFSLKAGKRYKVYLNNSGMNILEVYSMKQDKLSLYTNAQDSKNTNGSEQNTLMKQELSSINEYTSYILLGQISTLDEYIMIESEEDDVDVLLELKQYTPSTLPSMISHRSQYYTFSINDYIITIDGELEQDMELVYLFVSDNQDDTTHSSIVGESQQGLVHFQSIKPKGQELKDILSRLQLYPKLYFSIRAYDKLRRVYLFQSIFIDNPFSEHTYFQFTHLVIIIAITIILLLVAALLASKHIRKTKLITQSDELELIHHQIPTKSNYSV